MRLACCSESVYGSSLLFLEARGLERVGPVGSQEEVEQGSEEYSSAGELEPFSLFIKKLHTLVKRKAT